MATLHKTSRLPHFVKDQVLTPEHLNGLAQTLSSEDRETRVRAIGVGIVSGLALRREGTDAEPEVVITCGAGITSDGHLAVVPEATRFVAARPFVPRDPTDAAVVADAGLLQGALELVEAEGDGATRTSLADAVGRTPIVVLYVEQRRASLEHCDPSGACIEQGLEDRAVVRALLLGDPSGDIMGELYSRELALPRARAFRVRVSADLLREARELAAATVHRLEEVRDQWEDLLGNLTAEQRWHLGLDRLPSIGPNLTWLKTELGTWNPTFTRGSASDHEVQLLHGLAADVCSDLNQLAALLESRRTTACPPSGFPRHLCLGLLPAHDAPVAVQARPEQRHVFWMPEETVGGETERIAIRRLSRRVAWRLTAARARIASWRASTAYGTRVWPERGPRCEPDVMPIIYQPDPEGEALWGARPPLHHDSQLNDPVYPPDFSPSSISWEKVSPLWMEGPVSRYRVEGYHGREAEAVRLEIEAIRDAVGLPFEVVVTGIDKDSRPPEPHGVGAVRRAQRELRAQAVVLWSNIVSQTRRSQFPGVGEALAGLTADYAYDLPDLPALPVRFTSVWHALLDSAAYALHTAKPEMMLVRPDLRAIWSLPVRPVIDALDAVETAAQLDLLAPRCPGLQLRQTVPAGGTLVLVQGEGDTVVAGLSLAGRIPPLPPETPGTATGLLEVSGNPNETSLLCDLKLALGATPGPVHVRVSVLEQQRERARETEIATQELDGLSGFRLQIPSPTDPSAPPTDVGTVARDELDNLWLKLLSDKHALVVEIAESADRPPVLKLWVVPER